VWQRGGRDLCAQDKVAALTSEKELWSERDENAFSRIFSHWALALSLSLALFLIFRMLCYFLSPSPHPANQHPRLGCLPAAFHSAAFLKSSRQKVASGCVSLSLTPLTQPHFPSRTQSRPRSSSLSLFPDGGARSLARSLPLRARSLMWRSNHF
jgi:hypothetical protein